MVDPVLTRASAPAMLVALVGAGLAWGALLGLASRPRWRGTPRWWPASSPAGHLAYGALAGLGFAMVLGAVTAVAEEPGAGPALALGIVWLVALALLSRIGTRTTLPLRPHLLASAVVIVLTFLCYQLLAWWVEKMGNPLGF